MDIKAAYAQIIELFQKLDKKQKRIILGSIIAVVIFISFLIVFKTTDETFSDGYRVLFDKIAPSDAALIVQQLEKDEVPYKLTNERTIRVPKEYVYSQRIKLAGEGLPKNSDGIGFELFDKKEFGETEFDQNIKYLRALEGELSKTIASLKPINSAIVHLAIPKESVFVSKQIPPSASVILSISENMILNSKQVRGIKNLVSSAVSRLKSEDVQIVDESGEPLGDNDEAAKTDEIAKIQLDYKKKYEKSLERKVKKLLAPIVGGEEGVVAKITVDFDFTEQNSQEEKFDPINVVRSEQLMEEKREGKKPKEVGGVPGAVSNIGPVQGIGSQSTEKYEKSDTTKNYEISKTVSNMKREFAIIKRVTVAVVIDGKYKMELDKESGVESLKYYKHSSENMQEITNIVKQAVGYNKNRNDEVIVSNFQFNSNQDNNEIKTSFGLYLEMVAPIIPILKYTFAIIILFIFYKLVILPFLGIMTEIKTDEEEENDALKKLGEVEDEEDELSKLGELKERIERELGEGQNMDEGSLRADVMLQKIKEIIEASPEDGATLFETLLFDDEDGSSNLKKGM